MKYSVHLISSNGQGSYLLVRGRTEWGTLKTARKHADDIQTLIDKGKNIFGAICVDVESEFGEIIKPKKAKS